MFALVTIRFNDFSLMQDCKQKQLSNNMFGLTNFMLPKRKKKKKAGGMFIPMNVFIST